MSGQHEYSSRIEAFFAIDVGGVPLALIICAVAAVALGFGVAVVSTVA